MPTFFRPDGTCIEIAPAMPRWDDDDAGRSGFTAAAVTAAVVAIHPYMALARGGDARLDVAWAIDILRARRDEIDRTDAMTTR